MDVLDAVFINPGVNRPFAGISGDQNLFYTNVARWILGRFFRRRTNNPIARQDTDIVANACHRLRPLLDTREPMDLANGHPPFNAGRRWAALTLSVRMAEYPWPYEVIQSILRELIDMAQITANVGLPPDGLQLALRRYANMTLLFNQPPLTVNATMLLPQANAEHATTAAAARQLRAAYPPLAFPPIHAQRSHGVAARISESGQRPESSIRPATQPP